MAGLCLTAGAAQAGYTTIDLSPYVNEGFTNGWFINGATFAPIIGATYGNQGSAIPFNVANPSDGNGGNNNFWFGLAPGLTGPIGSVTIPIAVAGVTSVYTLADNTFGVAGNTEYSVTFNGSGGPLTENYIGGVNTKDYNLNCATTGCDTTPGANYWFENGQGQWLQEVQWVLPVGFGLTSITFNQIDGTDGAILAGVTVAGGVPEASTWAMLLVGFAGLGFAGVRASRKSAALAA
jgi:hypothetical protein